MDKKIEFYMTCSISADMDSDNAFACEIGMCINKFVNNNWGDLCEDDKELNRAALKKGGRVLAAYTSSKGKIYIITDDTKANPQRTTVLYASEY